MCDSQIRDCVRIKALEFPVFYAGIRPLDSKGRGRVMDYDVPVRCGEVVVQPGDVVFADFDGVVVIPKAIEDEVINRAHMKVKMENLTRDGLMNGRTLRSVYDEYGAL